MFLDPRLLALRYLANSWGYVVLCNVPYETIRFEDPDTRIAPFSHSMGVHPAKSTVFASDHETNPIEVLCGLIHELGHLCVGDNYMDPNIGEEYDFFGWEIVVADAIGMSRDDFIIGNRDYIVEGMLEIGSMTVRRRKKVFLERIEFAKRIGIVSGSTPLVRRWGQWKTAT